MRVRFVAVAFIVFCLLFGSHLRGAAAVPIPDNFRVDLERYFAEPEATLSNQLAQPRPGISQVTTTICVESAHCVRGEAELIVRIHVKAIKDSVGPGHGSTISYITLSNNGTTGTTSDVNVRVEFQHGLPEVFSVPRGSLASTTPFPGYDKFVDLLCHHPPGNCCWKQICYWDPCCCRYVWRWVQYPCREETLSDADDGESGDYGYSSGAEAATSSSDSVRMVQHWTDPLGNARQQVVAVSREFAAKWGYVPEPVATPTTHAGEESTFAEMPQATPDAIRTYRMIEHWTDEAGLPQSRTVYVNPQFALRHGAHAKLEDRILSASLTKDFN